MKTAAFNRGSFTIAILSLLCGSARLHAHEIGTTRVSALFQPDQTYQIEIVTDAASLSQKLDASAGADPTSVFRSHDDLFRRRIKVTFDGAEVRPAITYSVAAGNSPGATPIVTIKLTGREPANARHFNWTYGWTFASYALTIRNSGSDKPTTEWLEGGQSSSPLSLTAPAPQITRMRIAWRYLALGFTHILPYGLDHMLFVLGIYLLSARARSLLWQVSAFTVAHSITLGLSMYGLISVSPRIVEPMIAVSIAYIAIENIFLAELKSWRVALVFAFGLLHGMGFAGALKELGLPRSEFVTALLTFNIGVEGGQLAVIGAAFLLIGWHYANRAWYRGRIVVPASAVIGCIAAYWTFERLAV